MLQIPYRGTVKKESAMRIRNGMIVLTLLVLGAALASPLLATGGDAHTVSIEEAISHIRSELGLSPDEAIDPDAVPSPLLEELGDAVMADMAGSEAHHEWMDTMMGGEGSESLGSAHRWMGYRYLTGGYGPYGPGPGPDGRWDDRWSSRPGWGRGPGRGMHGGMMGPGMMGGWGMMGNPRWGAGPETYDSPEEIARRRYARGEITTDEFREIMDELER
jgi:hypothetical protein